MHAHAPSRRVALSPSPRPAPGPCSPAEPRPALAHSPLPSKLALQRRRQSFWRHAGVGSELLPWTAPPKPPARASCPLEQPELIHKLVGTRSSPPRRPAATERRSPAFLSTAAAGPTSNAYIRGPRARPSTQATSFYPPSAPTPNNQRREAFFPVSGQFGRRRNPAQYVAARPSPVHPTPPTVSP